MILFIKPRGLSDELYVGHQKSCRLASSTLADLQRGRRRQLKLAANLRSLGRGSYAEFRRTFGDTKDFGNWYERTDDIDSLLAWASVHQDARPVEFRRELMKYGKSDLSSAIAALVQAGGVQRRVCSVYAKRTVGVCPGCQADIDEGEWYNEAEDKFWHSMCTPLDKLVVGHLLDSEENKIKDILLSEEPTATEWIERIT